MGYLLKNIRNKKNTKKQSIFECYTKLFNEIKYIKCDFFIKRVLFKSLVALIETESI